MKQPKYLTLIQAAAIALILALVVVTQEPTEEGSTPSTVLASDE